MCVAVGKYFPAVGWAVAKNRDRNYDVDVSFDERTTENGLDVLVYRDDVTGYTEGLNSNGVAVVSTALLVLDDEKEAEKERESKLSRDGQKINRALELGTALEAAQYLIEEELSGHTLVADKCHLYHLEADKNDGEYEWKIREVPHDETVSVTNHGLRLPEAGYQLPGDKGRSSRVRLRVAQRLVDNARSPRELLDSLIGSYTKDPAMNVARTATDSSKLRTTAQVLLVPGERTVYFRPVTSSLTFDYFKLQNPKSRVWLEVLNQRPLYEAHDAEANGKAKLKHRLRSAVKKAVAKGAEVEANYSEYTGGFNPRAALLARAKQAVLLEFASFSEAEKWEFTRCVRPDGSAYGSRGKCRKGSEQAKKKDEAPTGKSEGSLDADKSATEILDKLEYGDQRKVLTGFIKQHAYEPVRGLNGMGLGDVQYAADMLGWDELTGKDLEEFRGEKWAKPLFKAAPPKRGKDEDDYSESILDFTTCARSDGSLYGTAGKCRTGKEVSEDQAALQRAANARRKSGRYSGTLKQRVARDATANHLGAQHRELEKKHRAAKRRFDKAADELENDRWNAMKRDIYKKAERESNAVFTAAERAKARLKRRIRELTEEHAAQNRGASRKRGVKLPDVPEWANETGKQLG